MKFLVFNIIVLFSLGYLLTSKPNENFSDWTSDKKNKISNLSKDQIVSTIKKATAESKVVRDFTENQVNKDTLKNDTNEINTSIVSDIREKVKKAVAIHGFIVTILKPPYRPFRFLIKPVFNKT